MPTFIVDESADDEKIDELLNAVKKEVGNTLFILMHH